MANKSDARAEILIVDDCREDIRLVQLAFREAGFAGTVRGISNGEEGFAYLRREKGSGDCPTPDLILLDLNMPRMDGRELLEALKSDPNLRRIPVAVWTTSSHDEDVAAAYDRHANCYLVKPEDFSKIVELAQKLAEFWFEWVKRPPCLERPYAPRRGPRSKA